MECQFSPIPAAQGHHRDDRATVRGSTYGETLAAPIHDRVPAGRIDHETPSVWVLPVPGRRSALGGLFGASVILPIPAAACSTSFLDHDGRIPAPLSSLRMSDS